MSRGYEHSTARFDTAQAIHGVTALRLIGAQERLEIKGIRAAFTHPAARHAISAVVSARPLPKVVLTAEEIAALESELQASVQKVLAIMAIVISETEADIAGMNDLMDIIDAMDRQFFDFAGEHDPAERIASRKRVVEMVLTYLEKMV